MSGTLFPFLDVDSIVQEESKIFEKTPKEKVFVRSRGDQAIFMLLPSFENCPPFKGLSWRLRAERLLKRVSWSAPSSAFPFFSKVFTTKRQTLFSYRKDLFAGLFSTLTKHLLYGKIAPLFWQE